MQVMPDDVQGELRYRAGTGNEEGDMNDIHLVGTHAGARVVFPRISPYRAHGWLQKRAFHSSSWSS
jgi:hypothetical protein